MYKLQCAIVEDIYQLRDTKNYVVYKISSHEHKSLTMQTFVNLSLPNEGDAEVTADGVHQKGFPLLRKLLQRWSFPLICKQLTLNNKQTDLVYTLGLRGGPTHKHSYTTTHIQ